MTDTFVDGDPFDPEYAQTASRSETEKRVDADDAVWRDIERRRQAYARVFNGVAVDDDVNIVMLDLSSFCRAFESTYAANPRDHALLEGRREVYLRIMQHTGLNTDTLFKRYTQGSF